MYTMILIERTPKEGHLILGDSQAGLPKVEPHAAARGSAELSSARRWRVPRTSGFADTQSAQDFLRELPNIGGPDMVDHLSVESIFSAPDFWKLAYGQGFL